MTNHQKSSHRFSAISLLCVSVVTFCCMCFVTFHTISKEDARDMVLISAIASLVFSLWSIYNCKVGRVSIRSVKIDRKSEPSSFRLAMLGYLIIDSAFWICLIWSSYVLFRRAA
jgi:uncharacterized membrane protein